MNFVFEIREVQSFVEIRIGVRSKINHQFRFLKMDFTSNQKKHFIRNSNDDPTFANDPHLPVLPVPSLESTINKYLKSIKPFVNGGEFKQTERICSEFLQSSDAEKLQNLLIQRSKVIQE